MIALLYCSMALAQIAVQMLVVANVEGADGIDWVDRRGSAEVHDGIFRAMVVPTARLPDYPRAT